MGKLIYFVILDLIILTYTKPGGYNHKPHKGDPDWGHDVWYHGWHHDSHDWHHDWHPTTERAKTTKTKGTTGKTTIGKRSTDIGSTTTTPRLTSLDIDIRMGVGAIISTEGTPTFRPLASEKTNPTLTPFVSATKPSATFKPFVPETQKETTSTKAPKEQTFQIAQFIPFPDRDEDTTYLKDENTAVKEQTFQIAEFIPIPGPNEDKTDQDDGISGRSNGTVDSIADNGSADAEANRGDEESDQSPYNWHVMVYDRKLSKEHVNKVFIYSYKCGGTLVKANLVISAAHCFFTDAWIERPSTDFRVAAGKRYPGWDDPRDRNAQYNVIAHYRTTLMVQPCVRPDLAFLFMSEDFTFNDFVRPACVNFKYRLEYYQLKKGNLGTVATSASQDGSCKPSEQINWLSLPYVEEERCSLQEVVGTSQVDRICAGNFTNFTQCDTDSGNGLVFFENETPYLRGFTSFIPPAIYKPCLKWSTSTRSFTNLGAAEFNSDGEIREIFDSLIRKSTISECENLYNNTSATENPFEVEAGNDTNYFEIQGIGSDPVPPLEGTSGRAPSFQWHVGIYSKMWSPYLQICGGSLVKRDFVISAAHCFWDDTDGQLPETQYAVAGGKLYRPWNEPRDTYAQQSDVSELILPVRFRGSSTSFQEDIALLRLSSPFTYAPGVQPVCVDFNEEGDREQLQNGNQGTVAGWGLTHENGSPSQRLNFMKLPYTDLNLCFEASSPSFFKYITSDKICAGTQSGKALCRGDSGGGLVFYTSNTPFLRGIASTAANNENLCNAYVLAAFTHIYAHRSFIKLFIPDVEKECDGIGNKNNDKAGIGNLAGVGSIGADAQGNLGTGNRGTFTGAVGIGTGTVGVGTGNVETVTGNVEIGSGTVGMGTGTVGIGTGIGNIRTGVENVGAATPTPVETTRRNIMPVMDTTPSYASVPYNHFVCNCNCKP